MTTNSLHISVFARPQMAHGGLAAPRAASTANSSPTAGGVGQSCALLISGNSIICKAHMILQELDRITEEPNDRLILKEL